MRLAVLIVCHPPESSSIQCGVTVTMSVSWYRTAMVLSSRRSSQVFRSSFTRSLLPSFRFASAYVMASPFVVCPLRVAAWQAVSSLLSEVIEDGVNGALLVVKLAVHVHELGT